MLLKSSGNLKMSYSVEMQALTTWLMVGGGIIILFSLVACNRTFAEDGRTGLAKTIAMMGFWISFFGAYMDHRFSAFW